MQFLSAPQFKALTLKRLNGRVLRQADAPLLGIRKASMEPPEILDERTLRFTCSTGCVDRDQDVISVGGWQLENFERNPVVLWSHRADDLPIGKVVDIGTDATRLFAAVRFLPAGYGAASDLAETVYRMAQDGYLSATSVGFRPIDWELTDDPARVVNDFWPGVDFSSQELIELSLVSVPSNPEALIEPAIVPGDFGMDSAPVITPAPVQILEYQLERLKRRARAALVGVF